jgi:hypothetical protein
VLDFLAENITTDTQPALVDAVRGLLAGIDYRDPAIVGSHWQALREAIAATADAEIERHLRWAQQARQLSGTIRALGGSPGEEFDRLGRTLGVVFDRLIASMDQLKAHWVELAHENGTQVRRAGELDAASAELADLRKEILGTWPWSSKALSPVDRGMVERSRAAAARGEGEPVEDVIRRIAGHPTKG